MLKTSLKNGKQRIFRLNLNLMGQSKVSEFFHPLMNKAEPLFVINSQIMLLKLAPLFNNNRSVLTNN